MTGTTVKGSIGLLQDRDRVTVKETTMTTELRTNVPIDVLNIPSDVLQFLIILKVLSSLSHNLVRLPEDSYLRVY